MSKSKPKKMMPIINRGTWTRVHAYRKVIEQFLNIAGLKQIISFGAGLDTTYFYYKSKMPTISLKYVEIDFPEIVAKKQAYFTKSPDLIKMKSEAENYQLITCDLRDIAKLEEEIKKIKLDPKNPTLILTECVLVYMEPEHSQNLVNFCTKFFENCAIINYEMINPHDSFGKVMVENIEDRGCKLLGLREIDSIEKQKQRFLKGGFEKVFGVTMLEFWEKYAEKAERARIEKIEIFDEFEEWNILQSHYCVILGLKGSVNLSF